MRFSSEFDRKRHELARMIPDAIWSKYFKYFCESNVESVLNDDLSILQMLLMRIQPDEIMAYLACEARQQQQEMEELTSSRVNPGSIEQWHEREKLKTWFVIAYAHQDIVSDEALLLFAEHLGIAPIPLFNVVAALGKGRLLAKVQARYEYDLSALIAADRYEIVRFAAACGHVDILNQLLNAVSIPESMQEEERLTLFYTLFLSAAEGGHFEVIKYLANVCKQQGFLQTMLTGDSLNPYEVFCKVARAGHLEMFHYLVELAESSPLPASNSFLPQVVSGLLIAPPLPQATIKTMIEAQNYAVFNDACARGPIQLVTYMFALAQRNQVNIQAMLTACNFNEIVQHGDFEVFKFLLEQVAIYPVDIKPPFEAAGFGCFWSIDTKARFEKVKYLLVYAHEHQTAAFPINIKVIIEKWRHAIFRVAAEYGDLDTLKYLVEIAPIYEVSVAEMLQDLDGIAFSRAAGNGYLPIVVYLHDIAIQFQVSIVEMLLGESPNELASFVSAASHGCLKVMKYLMRLAELHALPVREILESRDYLLFSEAAQYGHLDVFNFLVELAEKNGVSIQAMLENNDCFILAIAFNRAQHGIISRWLNLALKYHVNVGHALTTCTRFNHGREADKSLELAELLVLLCQQFKMDPGQIFLHKDFFYMAAQSAHHEVVNRMLEFASIFKFAEDRREYYFSYIVPFVKKKLQAIHHDSERHRAENSAVAYDLPTDEEAELYCGILSHLIRLNDPAYQHSIIFLLTIPAICSRASNGGYLWNHNDLLRHAFRTGNLQVAKLLLAIPQVHERAKKDRYYPEELASGALDLQQLDVDLEPSSPVNTRCMGIFSRNTPRERPNVSESPSCCVCM